MGNNSIEQLDNNFKYHTPNVNQLERYNQIREQSKKLACLIIEVCPNSRERSVAMTKLEETSMWANKSIAMEE